MNEKEKEPNVEGEKGEEPPKQESPPPPKRRRRLRARLLQAFWPDFVSRA